MRLNETTLRNRLKEAVASLSLGTRYKLGAGDFGNIHPFADCTAFASHLMGMSRKPKKIRNWWIESTNIFRDAIDDSAFRKQYPNKTFVQVSSKDVVPGCFIVAPDGWFARLKKLVWPYQEGHIALVESVERGRIVVSSVKGIDCSGSRGISRRDVTFMLNKGGIFVTLAQDVIKEV